jgi:hypothetical protein
MTPRSHKLWRRLLALGACLLGGCIGPGLEPPHAATATTPTSFPAQPKPGVDAGAPTTAEMAPGMQPGAQPTTPASVGAAPGVPVSPPTMPSHAPGAVDPMGGYTADDDDAGIPDAAVAPDATVLPDAAMITPAP